MAQQYFVVTPGAHVYRCHNLAQCGPLIDGIEGAVIANDNDMKKIPSAVLVKLHNRARPERPITKFSDRATAEKRLQGVLDLLATDAPSSDVTPTPTPVATPKKGAAKKTATPKAAKVTAPGIDDDTVRQTIELRKAGKTWTEIVAELGVAQNFVLRVRPYLRAADKTMVKALGPGTANYGKAKDRPKSTPAARKAAKRVNSNVKQEKF